MMIRNIEDVIVLLSEQQKEIKGLLSRVDKLEKENEILSNKAEVKFSKKTIR